MTEDAKRYLHKKEIPKLFEGLMTGLIHAKPEDPVDFMQAALRQARIQGDVQWDTFVKAPPPGYAGAASSSRTRHRRGSGAEKSIVSHDGVNDTSSEAKLNGAATNGAIDPEDVVDDDVVDTMAKRDKKKTQRRLKGKSMERDEDYDNRPSSVMERADGLGVPEIPIILFMGGPGLGKTRHAFRLANDFTEHHLVHICTPDLIKAAILKYKDKNREWAEASKKYERGELIAPDLALGVVKSEMARYPEARAYLLEGFPRDLQQVKDFESEISKISLAIILDFDEETLKGQMRSRGLQETVIKQRLSEYKKKTLPAAKYFDDKMLLHLIAGEQEGDQVLKQCSYLVKQALGLAPPPMMPVAELDDDDLQNEQNGNEPGKSGSGDRPGSASSKHSRASTNTSKDSVPTGLPNDAPVLLVVGAPGSHRNEYCRRIVSKYDGFVHISVGDLIRAEMAKSGSRLAKHEETMKKGDLLPTRDCRKIVHRAIHQHKKAWGYVIDGYPRTVEQAKDFEQTVDRLDLVILIDCTEQYCMNNLKARAEKGDKRRPDDTTAAYKERLAQFKRHTLQMLKYFEDKKKLKVVRAKPKLDGERGVTEVFPQVTAIIDTTLFIPESEKGDGQSLESSKTSKQDT